MHIEFLMILTLVAPFCSNSNIISSINIQSVSFCKLAQKKCSERNAPHLYQCDSNLCALNEIECEKYLIVKLIIKSKKSNSKFKKSLQRFRVFQSKIGKCSEKAHDWQPSGVCIRERYCFQLANQTSELNNIQSKSLKRKNCPCPKNISYACGSQKSFCSLNRKICDSFRYTYKNLNSNERYQLLSVKKCGNNFFHL